MVPPDESDDTGRHDTGRPRATREVLVRGRSSESEPARSGRRRANADAAVRSTTGVHEVITSRWTRPVGSVPADVFDDERSERPVDSLVDEVTDHDIEDDQSESPAVEAPEVEAPEVEAPQPTAVSAAVESADVTDEPAVDLASVPDIGHPDTWPDWVTPNARERAPLPVPVPTIAVPMTDVPATAMPLTGVASATAAPAVAHVETAPPRAARERRVIVPWRRNRPRIRKVTRVVRRVDPWTVFKVSLVLYAVAYAVLLIAGLLLWSLAISTGTVSNIEGFIKDVFALKTFTFNGTQIFKGSWTLGLLMVVGGTGLHVVGCVLFNLIADLVGGIRVTVLEEEVTLRERTVRGRSTAAETIDARGSSPDNLSPPKPHGSGL